MIALEPIVPCAWVEPSIIQVRSVVLTLRRPPTHRPQFPLWAFFYPCQVAIFSFQMHSLAM